MANSAKVGRWLGIDYGEVRVGIAISDPLGFTARGIETIRWNGENFDRLTDRICELIKQNGVDGLVVGIPRRTDGKPGVSEQKARELADLLHEKTGIEPELRDERYTTVLAGRVMREVGIGRDRRKAVVDQIAAEIILQEYLESRRKQSDDMV